MIMDSMKHRRLQELDRSDFQIVDGEPDIRGWDVKTGTGQKIGAVEELILDAKEKKVRYMVVDLNNNELKLDHKKVLIPIGLAELDRKEDDVLIPRVSPQQFDELPDYDRDRLSPDEERRIFSTLEQRTQQIGPQTAEGNFDKSNKKRREANFESSKNKKGKEEVDSDFYRHEYYNVDNLYKNRMHEAEPLNKNQSEYERGLHLWERRSEGTVIPDNKKDQSMAPEEYVSNYPEITEESRREMIKNRRSNYMQRRYSDDRSFNDRERGRNEE